MEFDSFGFGMIATPDYLMTIGGNPDRVDTMRNFPGAKSWQWMSDMDSGRQHNSAENISGWVYSVGGETGWMQTNRVDVYHTADDVWATISPKRPAAAYSSS